MINSNKNYDLDGYNKQIKNTKSSAKKRLAFLQRFFVVMSGVSLVLGIFLVGGIISKLNHKDKDEPLFDFGNNPTTTTEATTSETIATIETTPSPTPYGVKELLPVNTLADNYWGELVECENPLPYEHYEVHGLYINAAVNLDQNLEICDNSEINSLVIDLKESGVYFNTSNEQAIAMGCVYPQYDLQEVVDKCHEHGVHVIGRIVCFKDPWIVSNYPDRAICDSEGNILHYWNEGDSSFASPYCADNWDYFISLAEEALSYGVDEIQFDYVRFPTGGSNEGTAAYFGEDLTVPSRADAINRFMQTARIRIQDTYGIPVSFDIFGIAVTSPLDGDILGQDWATVGLTGADSLCPMIYPSHYALGTILDKPYDKPDLYPYEIMYNALKIGSTWHNQTGYAVVRPYVQAFTAAYIGSGNYMTYDYDAINAQIKAIQDAGSGEFILWNATAEYPVGNYGGNND